MFPEDVYFDKVTTALSSKSSGYDAFMTGAYQTWQYGPAGWLVDLNEFIKDPAATSPDWNVGDILPGLLHSDAWSGVPGEPLGGPNAKQWALPWGFELNSISYNKRILRASQARSAEEPARSDREGGEAADGHQGHLRHRRARQPQLGDDPSGLPLRAGQLRRSRLHGRERTSSSRR